MPSMTGDHSSQHPGYNRPKRRYRTNRPNQKSRASPVFGRCRRAFGSLDGVASREMLGSSWLLGHSRITQDLAKAQLVDGMRLLAAKIAPALFGCARLTEPCERFDRDDLAFLGQDPFRVEPGVSLGESERSCWAPEQSAARLLDQRGFAG